MKIFDHFGRMLVLLAAMGAGTGLMMGCEEEQGPLENAAEQTEDAAEEAADNMEDAGEEMQDAAEEATGN